MLLYGLSVVACWVMIRSSFPELNAPVPPSFPCGALISEKVDIKLMLIRASSSIRLSASRVL